MKLLRVEGMGILFSFSIVFSGSAITNEWTKATSGNWEEPYWSLGVLPSADQETVAFRNLGWKAVAIGANTTANFPGSLTLNNLIIDGPTNSANQLLLNWAGLNVPLVVRSNLMIGTNGSLASHSSALRAANFDLRGAAAFSDIATAAFGEIVLRSGGALNLHDASLASSNLVFFSGTVTQTAGTAVISSIATQNSFGFNPPGTNAYFLSNGVLLSETVSLGRYDLSSFERAAMIQSGGVHSNVSMTVWGGQRHFQNIHHLGHYSLSAGLLVSEETTVYAGTMEQSGGTNLTGELVISGGGYYTLNGGQLVTSNTAVGQVDCLRYGFSQNGGSHTVRGRLRLDANVSYSFSGGTLSAPIIDIDTGAGLGLGGAVSNSGMVLLRGTLGVGSRPQQLGKLQVLERTGAACGSEPSAPATLYIGSTSGPATLRFADSRDLPWSGTLRIINWTNNRAGGGPDHIFVGNTSQALTFDQLRRVIFIRPSGLPSDYDAVITAAGELVPGGIHVDSPYDYEITNGTITITGYSGPTGNITIPSTINNLPVTSIGDGAFNRAFGLTGVTIPNTVTRIGDEAFFFCTDLTSITIPGSVTSIGARAFENCFALTNVVILDGVTHIGDLAFEHCTSLISITISASVSDIGEGVFFSCDNLLAITVDPNNLFYTSADGVLFNKSRSRLIRFPEGKPGQYVVPETVGSIEDYAFYACRNLTNVIMGASVTNIGSGAFRACTSLTNITIGNNVAAFGYWAFADCDALTSVILPETVTSIGGAHLFPYCDKLAAVYFRGDAPAVISDFYDSFPTIYYLPGTVGWGPIFAGRPTAPWFLPKPVILDFGPSFGLRTNRFGFVVSWATNASVVVERSSSMSNASWSAVSTGALTGGSFYFRDAQWTNYPNCFYRLRIP